MRFGKTGDDPIGKPRTGEAARCESSRCRPSFPRDRNYAEEPSRPGADASSWRVSSGKPDAGNPPVRFVEGEGRKPLPTLPVDNSLSAIAGRESKIETRRLFPFAALLLSVA